MNEELCQWYVKMSEVNHQKAFILFKLIIAETASGFIAQRAFVIGTGCFDSEMKVFMNSRKFSKKTNNSRIKKAISKQRVFAFILVLTILHIIVIIVVVLLFRLIIFCEYRRKNSRS